MFSSDDDIIISCLLNTLVSNIESLAPVMSHVSSSILPCPTTTRTLRSHVRKRFHSPESMYYRRVSNRRRIHERKLNPMGCIHDPTMASSTSNRTNRPSIRNKLTFRTEQVEIIDGNSCNSKANPLAVDEPYLSHSLPAKKRRLGERTNQLEGNIHTKDDENISLNSIKTNQSLNSIEQYSNIRKQVCARR
jgi:hypothetical protein